MKFNLAKYNKTWAALVAGVVTQFGVDVSDLGSLALIPPTSLTDAGIRVILISVMVYWVINREDKNV